ncbi:hypothetical protein NO1_1225 [Candidatus Termititenax aidoneus]|uniref:Uncharacterized protein n=1 Tax=Termititenax aidoneus TaxID=2218524 RepID=A0A388TDK6_TERA1|nr:hypothetical protein NO1_1225 [Candidatus Termititenax aidoneus]
MVATTAIETELKKMQFLNDCFVVPEFKVSGKMFQYQNGKWQQWQDAD